MKKIYKASVVSVTLITLTPLASTEALATKSSFLLGVLEGTLRRFPSIKRLAPHTQGPFRQEQQRAFSSTGRCLEDAAAPPPKVGLKSIPELTKDHNLESCFAIGNAFCYKTVTLLDQSLGESAKKVVSATWPLVEKAETSEQGKEVIRGSLDREVTMDLDESQVLWQQRLKALVDKGDIAIDRSKNPFRFRLSAETQERISSNPSVSKEKVTTIPIALKNINTIIRNRFRVLYGIELEAEWPFAEQ